MERIPVFFGTCQKVLVKPTKLRKLLNLAQAQLPQAGQTAPLIGELTYPQDEVFS